MPTFAANERGLGPAELEAYQKRKNPGAPSIADMYGGVYSETGKGSAPLVSRSVTTVPIGADGNPITAAQAIESVSPSGTQYFPPGPEYGYNALTGDYEPRRAGQSYSADGGKPNRTYGTSPTAGKPKIDLAAMFGNMRGRGSASFTGLNTLPIDSDVPLNLSGGNARMLRAPAATPKAVPGQTIGASTTSSIADMFGGPAKTNPDITYNYPLASPGDSSRPQILGQDMAFMPKSVQMSSRWNTGY